MEKTLIFVYAIFIIAVISGLIACAISIIRKHKSKGKQDAPATTSS